MSTLQKLQIARSLSELGVDVCEAGFPVSSPGDFEAVSQIAKEIAPLMDNRHGEPMVICGLSRAVENDIQVAYDALKHAPRHRIHTFLATSDIHLKHKLKISREVCIERATKAVAFARSLTPDVQFSAEDAGRTDRKFLADVCSAVIKAGATTLNMPDTVGFMTPDEYGDLFRYLIANVEGGQDVTWSTHAHNDLGLATANTLQGILGGARQVEVTINGIGERAGNSSLEEIAMCLNVRPNLFEVKHYMDCTRLTSLSQLVSTTTGIAVQPNKAIVGSNAFAHEAGIHQDGVLKHPETYEIMKPEMVGLKKNKLPLGKLSGRAALVERLRTLGVDGLSPEEVNICFKEFKVLADKTRSNLVEDDDLTKLVANLKR